MKNPNGYGSVVFLGNNRKRPYAIRVTTGYDDEGRQKYSYIDYFYDRETAMYELAVHNRNNLTADMASYTFKDAFDAWAKEINLEGSPKGTRNARMSAYNVCEPIWHKKIRQIKKGDLIAVLENYNAGAQSKKAVKTLMSHVFNWAVDNDIIAKNYSTNIQIASDDKPINPHRVLTPDEIKAATSLGGRLGDVLTILLYTGMRIEELLTAEVKNVHLDERYLIGGVKTIAGKNRTIPISEEIVPIIERNMGNGELLIMSKGKRLQQRTIRVELGKHFDFCFHDCRHTFVTKALESGAKKVVVQRIVGHKGDDVTDAVYTHVSNDEMLQVVNNMSKLYG